MKKWNFIGSNGTWDYLLVLTEDVRTKQELYHLADNVMNNIKKHEKRMTMQSNFSKSNFTLDY